MVSRSRQLTPSWLAIWVALRLMAASFASSGTTNRVLVPMTLSWSLTWVFMPSAREISPVTAAQPTRMPSTLRATLNFLSRSPSAESMVMSSSFTVKPRRVARIYIVDLYLLLKYV